MKTISFLIFIAVFSAATVFGQDTATQQQLDKLSGQIQDLIDAQATQGKHIEAMEKEISDLRDKINSPAVNNSASADDLKALAAQVQEIDKKRQDDRDLILKEIEKLGRVSAAPASHKSSAHSESTVTTDTSTPAPSGPQKGYDYTVKSGDYLSTIAKAYRDQGVKVTVKDILNANPGLDPTKLYVGKKIFIPDPNAK